MTDNQMIAGLRAAAERDRFRPKLLLVPDFDAGHALVRHLALTGTPTVNLRVTTPAALAAEAAGDALAAAGLTPASAVASLLLVEDLLAGADPSSHLGAYLGPAPRTAGLAEAFHRALVELRLAGLTAADLDPGRFETPAKGRAIREALAGYEQGLAALGLADLAQLYRLALERINPAPAGPALCLIPARLRLRAGLEQRFIEQITAGSAEILPCDPPGALALDPADIHLTHAFGATNEIRAALRRAHDARLPYDSIEIALTEYGEGSLALRDACAALAIPATFSRGLPAAETLPGRALAAFLDWIATGFPVPTLAGALADGLIRVPGAAPGQGAALADLLRTSTIGWGRERYLPALRAMEQDLIARLARTGAPDPRHRAYQARLEQTTLLRAWLSDLLSQLPPDHTVPLSHLCQAAGKLLAHAVADSDPTALTRLTDLLGEVERATPARYPLPEAARRLADLLAALTVGESGPRPGHLHITDIDGAGWSGRPALFLLGLDQERFPGVGLQDPVLLDHERERLNPALAASHQRVEQKRTGLAHLLAGHRGQFHASYSTFDTASGRAGFPSSAVLELARHATGHEDLDYERLLHHLGAPHSYAPPTTATPLDRQDVWLSRIIGPDGTARDASGAVAAAYPDLARGLAAAAARAAETLTPHDGAVGPDPLLDPRQNPDLVLSPSRIEELARCPLRYFFRYVLDLAPPEELEYDPSRWLDPAQRGQLLHALFERFLTGLRDEGVPRPGPAHEGRLLAMADAVAAEWRTLVPPPSEPVYEAERAELRRSALIFLKAEAEAEDPGTPAFFELDFGQPPVAITTAAGRTVRLRGRIDRVDRIAGSDYAIWDYKTGSTWAYDAQGYFKRGRQIQHALYAVAAEELLRRTGLDPAARVRTAGYLFPTERGEGARIQRTQDRREALGHLLDDLLDLTAQGLFVAAEDHYACKFCDYRPACGAEQAAEQTKAKLEASAELAPLKRISEYD